MHVPTLLARGAVPALLAASLFSWLALPAVAAPAVRRLEGHVPQEAVARAVRAGRVASTETVPLALTLPLRDEAGLDLLLTRLRTPGDPEFGHFLTPDQFVARFAPTEADYAAVAAFARAQGLTVTGTHPNRLLLDVAGPASRVEAAFGVRLLGYRTPSGRLFRAPDADPVVPGALAGKLAGVVGLDTAVLRRPHLRKEALRAAGIGSGPRGGLTPANIKTAYGLGNVGTTGAGQSIALFELDGYTPGDITAYENYFGIPQVPLQNVYVDGAGGAAGSSADEVTLDIEMALALAPGLSRVLVYETPNSVSSDAYILDGYNRIATDDAAQQVSTSWGGPENSTAAATLNSENRIFKQMAAQGQSIVSASGDNGAYDDGGTLSVDDPASQPYVTGIGGTTLTTQYAGGPYSAERVWSDPTDTSFSPHGSGGGGGVSGYWGVPDGAGVTGYPSYQKNLRPIQSGRAVPDVSLASDPQNSGYAIYFGGGWVVYGGTSCAAPLWAGITALVNAQRAAQSLGPIGFLNPPIYQLAQGARAQSDFHDTTTGDNLYYGAGAGFDDATGWGTPILSGLIPDLVAYGQAVSPAPSAADTRVLWDNASGQASLWDYSTSGGAYTHNEYGPYPGWTAQAIADGTDGKTRVLWDNANGQMSLWSLDNTAATFTQFTFGPYNGWSARAVSAGLNTTHILWNNTNGQASIWNYSTAGGTYTQNTYGPYPGWTAQAIADGPDGKTRVLWDNANGQMSLWSLDNTAATFTQFTFGPYPGWTANAVSVSVGPNVTHVLWNNTNGQASIWNYSTAGGTFTQSAYGPYPGWAAKAVSDGPDGRTRVLWDNTDGRMSLWSLDNSAAAFTQNTFGPFSGWTAVSVSSGY